MNGGPETKTAKLLEDITGCIMKTVKLITDYAPIGFFGFFADLVATYGPELVADYSRTLIHLLRHELCLHVRLLPHLRPVRRR